METSILEQYAALYDTVKQAEAELKRAKQELSELEAAVLDEMDNANTTQMKVGGRLYVVSENINCYIDKEQEVTAYQYIEEHEELSELLKTTINAQTLAGWWREKRKGLGPVELQALTDELEQHSILTWQGRKLSLRK